MNHPIRMLPAFCNTREPLKATKYGVHMWDSVGHDGSMSSEKTKFSAIRYECCRVLIYLENLLDSMMAEIDCWVPIERMQEIT